MPSLTPPVRGKKPWPMPGRARASTVITGRAPADSDRTGIASPAGSGNPAGAPRPGAVRASALNSVPICCGPASRSTAASISAARAGEAFCSCAARARSPSASQERALGHRAMDGGAGLGRRLGQGRKSTWAVRSASPGASSGSAKAWRRTAWKLSPGALRAGP